MVWCSYDFSILLGKSDRPGQWRIWSFVSSPYEPYSFEFMHQDASILSCSLKIFCAPSQSDMCSSDGEFKFVLHVRRCIMTRLEKFSSFKNYTIINSTSIIAIAMLNAEVCEYMEWYCGQGSEALATDEIGEVVHWISQDGGCIDGGARRYICRIRELWF